MAKVSSRTVKGFKEIKCSRCKTHLVKVDESSISAVCFRCVSKGMNPDSVMITDMTKEEYGEYLQKMITIWKTREQTS